MRAAVYCRLSEEDREKRSASEDSASIQNQQSMLLQYAMRQGWEIYRIYSDDDYAGADRSRPAFQQLLHDAEARRFDVVLCKTQSRFTRELELVEKYIHGLFPLWGVRFVSIVDNADTANKGNKKSRQINGLVNEWYLEDMSENIRSVLTNRRENGLHIGSTALYGYRKDPEHKGHLLIDEEAAAVVREVFTLFAQGMGKTAIARMLNDRGIPNPTEYKRQKGLRHSQPKRENSTLWKYAAIADMLENEMYTGTMVQGRYGSVSYKTKQNKPRPRETWYRVEGTHEAIIDRDLWERVRLLREQRAKPFASGNVGLFSRKARCAACGYALRSSKSKGRRYLTCPSRHIAKGACDGAFISEKRLENTVLAELRQFTDTYLDWDVLERGVTLNNSLEARQAYLLKRVSACEKRTQECAKATHALYLDKVKGILSESDYIELAREFAREKTRLMDALAELRAELAETEARIAAGENHRELLRQYTAPSRLTRELVEQFIDHIDIGRRIPGTQNVPICIYWKF